ncbi:hypothetical protein POM88_047417 [Heracleum sosnowskyi]|uniref:Uncharacterized protein n=1 Tax=Heracleum sosnowskyi TaxID=360622 RepID=A0AAD8GU99_9APIA|nr:hypothetical protein POM88_047417 [Heracleum sosnowskyi]
MLTCFGFGQSKPKPLPFASVIVKVGQLTLRTILKETKSDCNVKECGESFIVSGRFNPEPVLKALQKYGKPGSLIDSKFGDCPENLYTSDFHYHDHYHSGAEMQAPYPDYYQRYAGGVEMQAPYPDYYQRYAGGAEMQAPYPDYYQRYAGYGQSYEQGCSYGDPYVRNYSYPHNLHHA